MLGLADLRSWVIFVTYMVLSVSQALLVTATKDKDNEYKYNPTTVVLLVECLKLIVCVALYLYQNQSVMAMFQAISKSYKAMFLYFIPAFLYCLYNNLAFINLAKYDPTSYSVLSQFRVVISGVIFQVLFQKKLTKTQWFSLIILTLGCMTKELDHQQTQGKSFNNLFFNPSVLLILLQVMCSCFAGVYTEYLLKGYTSCGEVDIWIQNMFMYSNSIMCNAMFLLFSKKLSTALEWDSIQSVLHIKVVLVICNYAALGLVTSLFLKNLNSILKNFASAFEIMLTMVLSWAIFGIQVTIFGVLSTSSVVFAVQLYSRNPVVNRK